MSIDLTVWVQEQVQLPAALPDPASWTVTESEWAFEGEGWQVLVLPADDPPDEAIATHLPNAKRVFYLTLEPIDAPREAYELLEKTVRVLAAQGQGVWVDPDGEVLKPNEGSFY